MKWLENKFVRVAAQLLLGALLSAAVAAGTVDRECAAQLRAAGLAAINAPSAL
jgi:hypothetical protein